MTAYEPPTALPAEFLNRIDVQAAILAHDFGTLFRLAKEIARISYSKIAAECGIKPERVGALARGEGSITTFGKIVTIADALRVPGHLLGLSARPWGNSTPSGFADAISNREGEVRMQRRGFMRASAGAGLAAALPDLEPISASGKIGIQLPEELRRRAARLRRLDEILGGGDTYRVYLSEYLATKRLIDLGTCTGETRRALLSVLAEQAQQAGWAAFDGGKQADASGLYEASYQAALNSDDDSLAGNALAFLSYQKVSSDKGVGVEIARQSCRTIGPEAPRCVRALLYERLAWTCAVAGLVKETEEALNTAECALSENDDAPQPDWAVWVDVNELQIMKGRCWTELRRPIRAVPALENALSHFNETHARDKSLYLTWLADAYLAAGEIEQAADAVRCAFELSSGVASVRPGQRISSVVRKLRPYRNISEVVEVVELASF
ncbi:tetratricopeptide repeat protein [Streptomyces katsurahamanus]|uniref:XRE family transcriptional regulator n=1 Tax=Streptomyces katsurahamanus TaxID=2577098 RepID=A0ABW9P2N5_9ACTN|nr:XRE family transcriptional regulator [Streptomyces katsurahamanus]MQS39852.1 XRE family transcriptional regulator [Streptomyces katsurahamanus]